MSAEWDDRLMPAARALELCGDWPLTASYELARLSQFEPEGGGEPQPDQWQINLRCAVVRGYKLDAPAKALDDSQACGQSCGMLAESGRPFVISLKGDLLAAVMRHMVMAHNLSLSGAPQVPADQAGAQ